MRVIGNLQRQGCNITLFQWNNKYLIKLEAGPFEQTYKVNEFDLAGESDLQKLVSEEFVQQAVHRFDDMARSLGQAMQNLQVQ